MQEAEHEMYRMLIDISFLYSGLVCGGKVRGSGVCCVLMLM